MSAANRVNTEPVNRSNICTWPDPLAVISNTAGFYNSSEIEGKRKSSRDSQKGGSIRSY